MKKLTSLVALVLSIALAGFCCGGRARGNGPEPVPAEEILAYTQVYEPETSFVLSSTVAWNADETALEVAGAQARPQQPWFMWTQTCA